MLDVSVILINYNNAGYTLKCVQSVLEQTGLGTRFELIVVDNQSQQADYQELEAGFPDDARCKLVRNDHNAGFGGGNAAGFNNSSPSRYLLFLNNDCLLLNDCLGLLCAYMDSHPEVGVCTAQNYDQHGNLVPSFDHNKGLRRLLFGRGFLQRLNPRRYPERKKEYQQPITVDWVNGAFMFFRRTAYEQIGGFDTRIFLYWEEMDLCHRLRQAGYTSVLLPEARVLHYQGVSIKPSPEISKEAYRSYLYVVKKKDGWLKYLLTKMYLAVVFLFRKKKRYLMEVLWDANPMRHSLGGQYKNPTR